MKTNKILCLLLAAIMMFAAFSVGAYAAEKTEEEIAAEMAANSAAWYVAQAAGDQATMDALHEANQELAAELAGDNGSAEYDAATGTYNITTNSGGTVTSGYSDTGNKDYNLEYEYIGSDGSWDTTTVPVWSTDSLYAYDNYGGTPEGAQDAYNNWAREVEETQNYGGYAEITGSTEEQALTQYVLGLTDEEAAELYSQINDYKKAYEDARQDYEYNMQLYKETGDKSYLDAANKAAEKRDKAHEDAQDLRADYGYTADPAVDDPDDGGFFYTGGEGAGASDPGYPIYDPNPSKPYDPEYDPEYDPDPVPEPTPGPGGGFEPTDPENGKYYVKVRINGVVDETYTRSYRAAVDDVISKSMVDTSIVPDEYTITGIDNTPLIVSHIPVRNVIYINCEGAVGYYKVNYYLDGELYTSSTYTAPADTVIHENDVYVISVRGYALDEITGCPLTIVEDATGEINVYLISTEAAYTVKVRLDGVIDERYTRDYTADVGDIITTVDTSIVPDGYKVVDIENVPLYIENPDGTYIIIIDCEKNDCGYTVQYYLDGVLRESDYREADEGEVINNGDVPLRSYDGYVFVRIDGCPLTIVDNTGVVKVYYESEEVEYNLPVDAKLFADEYRTIADESKSGYGVYGMFKIDLSEILDDDAVSSFDVTVKATYKEGLPVTDANKNGRQTTVTMEYDRGHSTTNVWAYVFPANEESVLELPKAYIPINWADNSYWTVSFQAEVHIVRNGVSMTQYSDTVTARVYIDGNMYEDDFTGDRH